MSDPRKGPANDLGRRFGAAPGLRGALILSPPLMWSWWSTSPRGALLITAFFSVTNYGQHCLPVTWGQLFPDIHAVGVRGHHLRTVDHGPCSSPSRRSHRPAIRVLHCKIASRRSRQGSSLWSSCRSGPVTSPGFTPGSTSSPTTESYPTSSRHLGLPITNLAYTNVAIVDCLLVPLAALHDCADLRRLRARPRLAPRSPADLGAGTWVHLPPSPHANDPARNCGGLDFYLFADPR